ncbi:MAG: hypothetical protein V4628_05665 [Pseudomonadota bacterium]
MKHPGILLFTLLVIVGQSSIAATAFEDSVPAEVVNQVIGAAFGGQARLYTDLPEGFPAFALPDGMTILVGVDQGWSQRVILKSRFDYQAAIALAYGALLEAGWQLVPRPGTQMQQAGFINPQQPSPQTQLCHTEHGVMEVSIQSGSDSTYVNLMRNVTQPGMPVPDCNPQSSMDALVERAPQIPAQVQLQVQLQEFMPRLVLPRTTEMTTLMGGFGGGGGSINETETRAVLSGGWNLGQVFRHFADQIADQGWKRDARVTGDAMASGSWTKTVDNDVDLVANLTVLITAEDTYDLRFRLLREGTPDAVNVPAMGIRGIRAR